MKRLCSPLQQGGQASALSQILMPVIARTTMLQTVVGVHSVKLVGVLKLADAVVLVRTVKAPRKRSRAMLRKRSEGILRKAQMLNRALHNRFPYKASNSLALGAYGWIAAGRGIPFIMRQSESYSGVLEGTTVKKIDGGTRWYDSFIS